MIRQIIAILILVLANSIIAVSQRAYPTPATPEKPSAKLKEMTVQTETTSLFANKPIKIRAIQEIGLPLRLEFNAVNPDPSLGKEPHNLTYEFGSVSNSFIPHDFNSPMSALLRFKVVRTKKISSPLIIAVAAQPGATNNAFWIKIIGTSDLGRSHMEQVSDDLNTTLWGGIQIGKLGGNRGVGIAVWDYVWDFEKEARTGDHRYKVTFYPYNEKTKRFEKTLSITSRKRYRYDRGALNELGLGFFKDELNTIIGLQASRERHW